MIAHRAVLPSALLALGALVAAAGSHIAGSARDADLAAAVAALAEREVSAPVAAPVPAASAALSPRRGMAASTEAGQNLGLERRLAALEAAHAALLAELAAPRAEDEFEVAEAQAVADAEEADAGADDNPRVVLDETFDGDADDPVGGARAEARLRDALIALRLDGVAFTDAHCRASVCRLDIGFDAAGAARASMPMLALGVPWNGESYVEVLEDGRGTVMYVAREGYRLDGEPLD